MKRCNKCGEEKSLSLFHVARKSPDGRFHSCKECTLKHQREHYRRNRKAKLAANAAWVKAHPEKLRAYAAKARAADPERFRACRKKYRDTHREIETQRHRDYVGHHREEIRAWRKAHYWRNPDRYAMYNSKRRSGGESPATEEQWVALVDDCERRCAACGKGADEIRRVYPNRRLALEVDHIIPVSLGGDGSIGNLQPLCPACNNRKRKKAIDYRPRVVREKYGPHGGAL